MSYVLQTRDGVPPSGQVTLVPSLTTHPVEADSRIVSILLKTNRFRKEHYRLAFWVKGGDGKLLIDLPVHRNGKLNYTWDAEDWETGNGPMGPLIVPAGCGIDCTLSRAAYAIGEGDPPFEGSQFKQVNVVIDLEPLVETVILPQGWNDDPLGY